MRRRRWASGRLAARPLVLASAVLALTAAVAVAAPGELDTSFDGDGKKTIDYNGLADAASDVLVQSDGKVVLAGGGNPSPATSNYDFAVSRLSRDGSPDPSFDGDGTVGVDFGGVDSGHAAALQRDGKLVVAGNTTLGSSDVAVTRLNRDGSPDTTFDGDGKKTIDYTGSDAAEDVLVQPDGKVVLAGGGNPNPATSNYDFAVTRLNRDGSPDPSFDGDGTVGVNFGGVDSGSAAALQRDGKIVVAGRTTLGNSDVAVTRLNRDGSPDASFDGDGKKTIDYSGYDVAEDVLVQPDDRIVLAFARTSDDLAVTRLNPDGALDPSFDGDGTVGVDFDGDSHGYAAALQANGKIVVAGDTVDKVGSTAVLLRLQPGGSLDTSFSVDGKQTVGFPASARASAAALQPNGRILIAGTAGGDAFVARLEGDPVDSGGGPGGVPRCAGKRATIVGTSRRDRLRGTRRADVIVSLGGNDTVKGGRGNDLICAGSGNDSVAGESGNDRVYGQSGKDKLTGGSGNDRIDGGSAKDGIDGGTGRDKCVGGPGRDRATCERKRSI